MHYLRSIQGALGVGWRHLEPYRRLAICLVVIGLGLSVFWELAEELREGELSTFDTAVQRAIRPHHTLLLDRLAHGLSALPKPPWVLLLVLPFLGFLLAAKHFRAAVWMLLTPVSTVLVVELLKFIFARDRPLSALVAEIGYSFPSGHATGATVLYGCLGYVAWRYWVTRGWPRAAVLIVVGGLILGTGLARVYLEVHYPTDVLAGWAAGLCILAGGIILFDSNLIRAAPPP